MIEYNARKPSEIPSVQPGSPRAQEQPHHIPQPTLDSSPAPTASPLPPTSPGAAAILPERPLPQPSANSWLANLAVAVDVPLQEQTNVSPRMIQEKASSSAAASQPQHPDQSSHISQPPTTGEQIGREEKPAATIAESIIVVSASSVGKTIASSTPHIQVGERQPTAVEHSHDGDIRRFDRAVELGAYEQYLPELEERLNTLLSDAPRIDQSVSDPNGLLVLSQEEIGRLWGLFPEATRNRAVPTYIQGFGSIWFTDISRIPLPYSTYPDNAVSLTTFALGATQDQLDESNNVKATNVMLCKIPEGAGFSLRAKRIAQTKVTVHELSHTTINREIVDTSTMLRLPSGEKISMVDFRERFADAAFRKGPISHYSASYRQVNGEFMQNTSRLDIPVNEELCETVAAYLLGFAVTPQGDLTFTPFEGREEIENLVRDYLLAQRITSEGAE